MPPEWVKEHMKWGGNAINTIENGARLFETTLTSTSIRYSKFGNYPVAVIYSENGIIKWKSINSAFPFQYVREGEKVNSFSKAYEFYAGNMINKDPYYILPNAWFLHDKNFHNNKYLIEQNVAMKNYNSVLTIVWEEG